MATPKLFRDTDVFSSVAMAPGAHHDQFVDVLRAVDELGDHVVRSVTGLDDLVASIVIYSRGVQIARIGDDFLDPPAKPVKRSRLEHHVGVLGRPNRNQPIPRIVDIDQVAIVDQVPGVVMRDGNIGVSLPWHISDGPSFFLWVHVTTLLSQDFRGTPALRTDT